MNRRLVREEEARKYLGSMSRGAFFDLKRKGLIKTINLGRAAYYDVRDLDAFVEEMKEKGL